MTGSSSGGGIVRGGPGSTSSGSDDMRSIRRRWVSGVTIVTVLTESGLRGATVSGFLPLSVEPPVVGLSLEADAGFQQLLGPGVRIGISILDRAQEFVSERFAGRAPVPDATFTGIAFRSVEDVPLLVGSTGLCTGIVQSRHTVGDHVLVLANVDWIEVPPDADDPMLLFEGRYRSLEIS